MKYSDKHSWTKTDNPNKHECKMCGCIRTKEFMMGRTHYWYNRSGIQFGGQRPDCLDWNDNTLD